MAESEGGESESPAGFFGEAFHTIGEVFHGAEGLNLASAGSTVLNTAKVLGEEAPAGMELFEGASKLAEEGGGIMGDIGGVLGPAGQIAAGVSGVMNGVALGQDIAHEGWENAYHDSEAYNHAGGALLGAAGAVLPFLGPYGEAANLALGAGEIAADAGGAAAGWAFGDDAKFSADSVAGGLVRGMAGDQSIGDSVRTGITDVFGDNAVTEGIGGAAQIATNVLMAPENLALAAGRGILNEGEAVVDSIANGTGAVGGFIHDAGSAVGSAVSSALSW
jgi:hypothetical protein